MKRRRALLAALALAGSALCPTGNARAREAARPGPDAKSRTHPYSRGLLWRIRRSGYRASHVFGTIHLADPRVLALPDPVRAALDGSRRLFGETYIAAREEARFFEAAQFEDGQTLEALIGADAYARVRAHLGARGIAEQVIRRVKPWAALLNYTVTPEGYERETLDQHLAARALERGLRVMGLEGIEEQIAVFDGIPMQTQVALLRHALEHRDFFVSLIEPAVQAWLRRDLAGIAAVQLRVGAQFPDMAAHYRLLDRHLVHNRSVVMAHRLFWPLREGRRLHRRRREASAGRAGNAGACHRPRL